MNIQQRLAIKDFAGSLLLYNTGDNNFCYYDNTVTLWKKLEMDTETISLYGPCPGLESFSYGGQTYTTLQIGTQCRIIKNPNTCAMIIYTDEPDNNITLKNIAVKTISTIYMHNLLIN